MNRTGGRLHGIVARNGFTVMVGSFVVVTSFLYGISRGMHGRTAHASADLLSTFSTGDLGLKRLEVPAGTTPVPLGSEMAINGNAAEMLSFTSDRSPQALTEEQMSRWRERGFVVAGKSTVRRGVAFALDRDTGERYSFSAWSVPGPFQSLASQGRPVQGLMSVVGREGSDSSMSLDSVPDVPPMPGGKGGAVISSVDRGARSYSSVYTNPGSLQESLEYYRTELPARGWRERFAEDNDAVELPSHRSANAVFVRGGEEVVLLMSPLRSDGGGDRTVVAVTRAGRSDDGMQRGR